MEIGVSLASYLPWSAWWPEKAAQWAKEDGFSFLQILPFKGINKNFSPFLPVKYIESAWNPTTFFEWLKRRPGPETMPQIYDWLFFPSPKEVEEKFQWLKTKWPSSQVTVHSAAKLGPGALLEVSPRLGLTCSEIIKQVKNEKCLVLDTFHIRRALGDVPGEIKNSKQSFKDREELSIGYAPWKEVVDKLLPFTALIHVQPMRENPAEDLELKEMLRIIAAAGYNGPYLVETTLGFKAWNKKKLRATIKNLLDLIKKATS